MSYTRPPLRRQWHSIDTLNAGFNYRSGVPADAAWPSANLAIYVPVAVQSRVVVKKLWYANGTVATGNYDIGLYDAAGVQLLGRGSTAKTTTADEIVWDCTDTTIGPGIYYLALALSVATDTAFSWSASAPLPLVYGLLTEANAIPLPATATFAADQTLGRVPVVGMFVEGTVA